ncbi:MAG: cobalamin-dependent protein [Opitutales bacterium]|nr:cobalamin-dependent protein [Opitutales bacterium]
MRILLVSLNRVADPYPVFPLGMAYVADALRARGHEVLLHDLLYQSEQDLEARAEALKPDVVALSLRNIDNVRADQMVSYIRGLRDLVGRLRTACAARIVVGGAGFSVFPDEVLEHLTADYGLCGEAESSFPALLDCLASGETPEAIPGLVYWQGGRLRRSQCVSALQAPDAAFAPDADWVAAYRQRGAVFNVQSQRGCPLRCCYCTYPLIEGRNRRLRSYERIVQELRAWKALGVNYVFFVDSVLNTSSGHLRRLAEALIEANTGMQWGCFMRPQVFKAEDLDQLYQAGLRHVEFGSDSFSDSVLKAYGKSFGFEEIRIASEQMREVGIHFCHFLIFGGLGESKATMEESFERSQKLPSDVFFAFPGMRVYPRTPLWHQLRERGLSLPENLLEPYFFIEPELSVDGIVARVEAQIPVDSRWMPADLPASTQAFVAKLRARKIEGPLWEYFGLLNRFAQSAPR